MKRQFGEGISCNVGVRPDRTPPFGSLPGTSKWEEQYIQNMLEGLDCVSHLAWGRLGIPRKNWEVVSGKRDIWNTLRASFHRYTNTRETEDVEWMDGN